MIAIASIPVILWALAMILFRIASDELSGGLLTALLSIIISLPFVALIILPALLNKTDKKWLIFVLSILLNWTFIGWVILLVVSINMNKEAERIKQQQMMMQMAGEQGNSNMFNPFH
ncbi:MAG: superinfection immunity protein [Streptococcus sp.]